jgi:hypothetical protein
VAPDDWTSSNTLDGYSNSKEPNMTHIQIRRAGAALLAATGALHLVLVPEYLEEATYIGVLFILGGLASIVIAARLWQTSDRLAWAGGALIAAGMAIGFVLSRSIGLPGFHETDWELSGLASVAIELCFLAMLGWHGRKQLRAMPAR